MSLIILYSVVKVKEKYYPQTLLEERKYEIKKTKMESFNNDDLHPSWSYDDTDSDSDNEFDNEPNKGLNKSSKKFNNESDKESDNKSGNE